MTEPDTVYREALAVAREALLQASRWLQGEYAKGPETPGAKVQVAVNDALAEVSRVLAPLRATAPGDAVKVAVCEYLLEVNRDHEGPFIPPTAIDWLGDGIVSAIRGIERGRGDTPARKKTEVHFVGGPWSRQTYEVENVVGPVFAVGHEIGSHYWLDTKSVPPTYRWDGTEWGWDRAQGPGIDDRG